MNTTKVLLDGVVVEAACTGVPWWYGQPCIVLQEGRRLIVVGRAQADTPPGEPT